MRRLLLGIALVALGVGIDVDHSETCPPPGSLLERASKGRLTKFQIACLDDNDYVSPRGREKRWVLWHFAHAALGPTPEVLAELRRLLPVATEADMVLRAAEVLADAQPDAAAEAAARGWVLSTAWQGPGTRADRLARLSAVEARLDPERGPIRHVGVLRGLGIVGPTLEAAHAACVAVDGGSACERALPAPAPAPLPPDADELLPCANLGRVWVRARWGDTYASDRECVARLVDALGPGSARATAARLAVLLAARHPEGELEPVIAEHVRHALPGDEGLRARAASAHEALGDPAGAAAWRSR